MTDMSARTEANSHFRDARAAKTASTSKQMSLERTKADTDKSIRLKAARLSRDAASTTKEEPHDVS